MSRSGLKGSCKMLGGGEGICTKEPQCPAVLEGRSSFVFVFVYFLYLYLYSTQKRIFPSLCTLAAGPGVGVCCDLPKNSSNQSKPLPLSPRIPTTRTPRIPTPRNPTTRKPQRQSERTTTKVTAVKPANRRCGQLQYDKVHISNSISGHNE